ncbi:hypothetical protein LUZ63_010637 [Rhynchospora breviuscula]|uniref:RNase H type-1 domain-containing protein n=1 Tax=Rhynchospora breviuscula TaxID=2022672 RepID=A0A9Q0CH80_9POAL|nr:hypothetical protein LUZ63_010637 [Rhynchospora breviuscula]
MEEGSEFYVLRKGNTVAVYKSLSECQAQSGSSVCDAAVSVYKGLAWSKKYEEYLMSHGLKNPLYTIDASDLNKDLFDSLVPCPFQDGVGSSSDPHTGLKRKGPVPDSQSPSSNMQHAIDSGSSEQNKKPCNRNEYPNDKPIIWPNQFRLLEPIDETPASKPNNALCILHFDGASKGNPGKAGAGALLKTEDGRLICRLSEGLGVVTNNVAEYKALLLGLRHALMKGFKRIDVQGDSMLVVMQVQGKWKVKHQDMIKLCKEVNEVKKRFNYFNIQHVRREFNSDADHQANLALDLRDGQVTEVRGDGF